MSLFRGDHVKDLVSIDYKLYNGLVVPLGSVFCPALVPRLFFSLVMSKPKWGEDVTGLFCAAAMLVQIVELEIGLSPSPHHQLLFLHTRKGEACPLIMYFTCWRWCIRKNSLDIHKLLTLCTHFNVILLTRHCIGMHVTPSTFGVFLCFLIYMFPNSQGIEGRQKCRSHRYEEKFSFSK